MPDLDALLSARLRHGRLTGPLVDADSTVWFDAAGGGSWTVRIRHGHAVARRGLHGTATTTVTADAAVLADVFDGGHSGVEAFLEGGLTSRGSLSLALQLDGLFEPATDLPHRYPRSVLTTAGRFRTVHLEAGPPDAAPVVLLHGLGATNASLLPLLTDLAVDHRVLAPDLPGFGASSAPRGRYDSRFFAGWLLRWLDELGLDRVTLVGNSMGGRIAVEAGLVAADRVAGLALLCPSPAFLRLRQFVPAVRLLRPEVAALPLRPSHAMVVEGIRAMFSDPSRLPLSWYDAAADEFARVMRHAPHRIAFLAATRQIYLEQAHGRRGFWDRLPELRVPSTWIWGERDRLVPAGFARHVQAAVPAGRSVTLADCGHVPQFERREQTTEVVRQLLVEVHGGRRRSAGRATRPVQVGPVDDTRANAG